MIKEKFVLASGSRAFARQVAAVFQKEGWQARVVIGRHDALFYSKERQDAPQYLITDDLRPGFTAALQMARELQPQGTQVILSGFMTPEELSGVDVPFRSIAGLPWKVAGVILGKEYTDEEMNRPLFPKAEIEVRNGNVFDRELQTALGLDGLVVFSWQGYLPMRTIKEKYLSDLAPGLAGRVSISSFPRQKPTEALVSRSIAKILPEVSDKGGHIIGITHLGGEDPEEGGFGERPEEMLLRIVGLFIDKQGPLLPIEKIFIFK